jgi:hypothetical protein
MHNYESNDAEERLPGPIVDSSGRPLLSWRVTILPFIEEQELYRDFHLDEPWDSPNNLALLDRMPGIYRSVGAEPPQHNWTFYRTVTGRDGAFDRNGKTLKDFNGRLEHTIFVVEAGQAVPWTKPDEWEYSKDTPLPPLGGMFNRTDWVAKFRQMRSGTTVAFGDGAVHFVPRSVSDLDWRKMLAGEKVDKESLFFSN